MADSSIQAILRALSFAAHKHQDQRRKGAGSPPFINHAIEVANIVARVEGITDPVTLQAAILHDTLEDTDTSPEELETEFGPAVRAIVEEVSDDRRLEKVERRRQQVETAHRLSAPAKAIRLADKIANVRAVAHAPPIGWSRDRRLDYIAWSQEVVAGCRGCCPSLERHYDEAIREALEILG
jgi:(p)ppGpp synthase/HD superfamily hydrolase